jgi:indolepyruvate ferredoxin oxidoreductase beta subunit
MTYIKADTTVIINRFRLSPPTVIAGKESYPDITPILKEKVQDIRMVEGSSLASELGNARGVNVILLGVLSTLLEPAESLWIETITDMLPEKIRLKNIEGFKQGRLLKVQ